MTQLQLVLDCKTEDLNKNHPCRIFCGRGDVMKKVYPVYYHENSVGNAEVEKCGMYYLLRCHCNLAGDKPYRIVVGCKDKEVDLGICIPDDTGFYLQKQIPIKNIGEEPILFNVVRRDHEEAWYPITQGQPFMQLSILQNATYSIQNGKPGLLVKKKA